MVLSLLALGCFFQEDYSLDKVVKLLDPSSQKLTAIIRERADPLQVPERSPKAFGEAHEHWSFGWETVAFETIIPGPKKYPRFLVFSQDRKTENNPEISVARMLERLWEYNYQTLREDHSQDFGDGVVEVFLCNGGVPGGEQLFDKDEVNGGHVQRKVNTIYFYDLPTFKNPLEMAREVAHEYGHATLVGVNGYKDPEDWANGFLGERLFLRHIAEGMKEKKLEPADAMGVTSEELDGYLEKDVYPLIEEAAQRGPTPGPLRARDSAGMKAFIGLALYTDTILPEAAFSRSMELLPSRNAEDYPEAVLLAAEEQPKYNLRIPNYLKGKNLWIPLGNGRLDGAKVIKRSARWAYIAPVASTVTVTASPIDSIKPL